MAKKGRYSIMEKSIFTNNYIKDLIGEMFNGNLDRVSADTPYINENSEELILKELPLGNERKVDLAQYLNIHFYDWQNKLRTAEENGYDTPESWLDSIQNSVNEAYALVETVDQKATESSDIDNGIKDGKITFLIQANKVSNLDYYVQKIRNRYMGEPFLIQNSYGKIVKAYLMLGVLFYDEEISETQLGTTLVASCNFTLRYMENATSYDDIKVEMSLDNGKHFYTMPLSSETWEIVADTRAVPKTNRADLTGAYTTAISSVKTLSFFDYNLKLTNEINDIFWSIHAINKNNIVTKRKQLDILVLLRVTYNGNIYMFSDIIDDIQKVITNGSYNITSITLKSSARDVQNTIKPYRGSVNSINESNNFTKTIASMVVDNKLDIVTTSTFSSIMFIKTDTNCDVEFTYTINDVSIKKVLHFNANEVTPAILDLEHSFNAVDTLNVNISAKTSETKLEVLSTNKYSSVLALY